MFYLVNLVDTRSTQEKPIAPKTIVVSSEVICDWLSSNIDANHYCVLACVDSVSDCDSHETEII